MPVLHVVDGVLHRLLLHDLDVEVHGGVVGGREQREAGGVDAHLVDQLVERDDRARRACSSSWPRRRAGTPRTGRARSRRPRDRSRAPRRRPSRARRRRGGRRPTRRSRGRSRGRTCRSGTRSPPRSTCARRWSARSRDPCRRRTPSSGTRRRPRTRTRSPPPAGDRRPPRSRPCAPARPRRRRRRSAHRSARAWPRSRRAPAASPRGAAPRRALRGRQVGEGVAVGGHDVLGDVDHVGACVPILGHRGLAAEGLEVARLHRGAEPIHLRAGVVEVVLALDGLAHRLEQARDRVAQDRVARVPDVQRARRVGAHELHLHPPSRRARGARAPGPAPRCRAARRGASRRW